MNKVTKEAAARLFRYVKRVEVSFNPLDPTGSSRSCRELMVQLSSNRIKKANPKMQIIADVHGRHVNPTMVVNFADDSEAMIIDTNESKVEELKADIFQRLMSIEQTYEAAGKLVD